MRHADDDEFARSGHIINGVVGVKHDSQVRTELRAQRTHEREPPQRIKLRLDSIHEAGRDVLRRFGSEVSPDFGQIGFRGLG